MQDLNGFRLLVRRYGLYDVRDAEDDVIVCLCIEGEGTAYAKDCNQGERR